MRKDQRERREARVPLGSLCPVDLDPSLRADFPSYLD